MDETTFITTDAENKLVTIIGDEKQAAFYPRLKIAKWDNEVNLSIGLIDTDGTHTIDNEKVIYETPTKIAEFYPITPKETLAYDNTKARYIDLGQITPSRLASVFELNEHIPPTEQTIIHYTTDQPTLLYWGSYARERYLDLSKIDIAEARLYDPRVGTNDPMYSDQGLHWIQINYAGEDVLTTFQSAIQAVLKSKGIETKIEGGKMYFLDDKKWVKFYSQATFPDKSFFYINLNNDYNRAYSYHNTDTPEIRDLDAYGLKLDETIIAEIIAQYQKNIGIPITPSSFTGAEEKELARIEPFVSSRSWIDESVREDVTPFHIDDAFEFAITLKEKPDTNVLPLSVTTKGLDFYYQRPLTVEERFNGVRPAHVLGSYAAYHKTKTNNEYQTGKAFHIYRPFAEDATGKKVWCELDSDWDYENDKPLNITVPQGFLDNAVYPILIDPTFGYTTAGASNLNITNSIKTLDSESAPQNGTGISIAIYRSITATSGGPARWKTALYTSAGVFERGTTEQTSSAAIAASWETISFTSTIPFAVGAKWLSVWGVQTGYAWPNIFYDTVSSAGSTKSVTYVTGDGSWPDPLSSVTDENNKYSIYVNYDASYYPKVVVT